MNHIRTIRWLFLINLILIIFAALWLRIFSLESIPLHNCDESIIGIQGLRLIRGGSFSWTTTSGNLIDPFLVALQAPFQAAMGPSLLALRIPAVMAGVGSVVLLGFLLRKQMGTRVSFSAALLLATTPIAILFSRHALEYGQTPVVGVFAAWTSWRGRPWLSLIVLLCGMLVHPTNVFLIPIFLPLLLTRWLPEDRPKIVRRLISVGVILAIVLVPFILWAGRNPNVADHSHESRNPLLLLRNLGRFLYARVGAESSPTGRFDILVAICAGVIVIPGTILAIRRSAWERVALIAGVSLGLAAFDVKAGAEVLAGAGYRYGAVFLIPSVLVLSVLIDEIAEAIPRIPSWGILLAFGWIGLGTVWVGHFRAYMADGADSITRFRSQDGFQVALKFIERDMKKPPARTHAIVLTQDVFLNSPQFEYLAFDHPEIEVRPLIGLSDIWRRTQEPNAFEPQRWLVRHTLETGGYVVQLDKSDPMRGGGLIEEVVGMSYPPSRVRAFRTPAWGGQSLTIFRLIDSSSPPD